jgi:hypothetical protein
MMKTVIFLALTSFVLIPLPCLADIPLYPDLDLSHAEIAYGGDSEGPVLVMINGNPLTSNAGLPLRFNSPDINGDLVANLADIAILSQKFGAHCP